MSDRKTLTDEANQQRSGGPSYGRLRELAARRAEARRGITRRDFVTVGAAGVVAAATVRDSFAETPEGAFNACIEKMKEGAKDYSFEPKVLEALKKHGRPIFDKLIGQWPDAKENVLRASFAIGEVSAALARLNDQNNSKVIRYPQARDGVAVVKKNCTVHWQLKPEGIFCPDLPEVP